METNKWSAISFTQNKLENRHNADTYRVIKAA